MGILRNIFNRSARDGSVKKSLNSVGRGGLWRTISEPFTMAWQRNMEEKRGSLITYPTLYACLSRIALDMSKLPFSLRRRNPSGVWNEVQDEDISPVLKKPNDYQTEGQFREYWSLSKNSQGNTYVLKGRDARGRVEKLYILDSERVMPMVSDSGAVFYQLYIDKLNNLPEDYPAENLIVPASEIIHDRCMTVHHPLIGVPPLAAAYWPTVKNMKILRSATEFFGNNAQPGGLLTAPAGMSDDDAAAVQEYWNNNFTEGKSGKVAIIGADMKFTPFAMKSIDAQMIEQMRYSDEQICQPFGIKPYKLGIGTPPTGWKAYDINTEYYSDVLQPQIEHMEALLDEGLSISQPLGIELNLDPLLRMDEISRAEVETKLVAGKIKTPDEGRSRFNLSPTGGGDTLWGQNQDYPLGMLANRSAWDPDMQSDAPAVPNDVQSTVNEMRAYFATQKAIAAMKKSRESTHDV